MSTSDKKRKAFDQGKPHHNTDQPESDTSKVTSQSGTGEHIKGEGTGQSGYKEKNPQRPAKPGEKDHPKVTNQDNKITNTDDNEEPVEEQSGPTDLIDNKDPEIDTPVHDPEKTEKKIPKMKSE